MWTTLLLAVAALLAAVTTPSACNPTYQETGDCEVSLMPAITIIIASSYGMFSMLQATHEQLYKYTAKEEYFGEEYAQTFELIIHFRVFCRSGKLK